MSKGIRRSEGDDTEDLIDVVDGVVWRSLVGP